MANKLHASAGDLATVVLLQTWVAFMLKVVLLCLCWTCMHCNSFFEIGLSARTPGFPPVDRRL